MVSSCYRRLGEFQKSLELYIQIHEDFPENIESLQYLESLCKDLGRPSDEYSKKLDKLRRSQPVAAVTQQQTTKAAPQRSDRPGIYRPQQSYTSFPLYTIYCVRYTSPICTPFRTTLYICIIYSSFLGQPSRTERPGQASAVERPMKELSSSAGHQSSPLKAPNVSQVPGGRSGMPPQVSPNLHMKIALF